MLRPALSLILTVAPLVGAANAQGSYAQTNASAAGNETINVAIPYRAALHITESAWNLNLNSANNGGNLTHFDDQTGEGCVLVRKGESRSLQDLTVAARAGQMLPVASYPAVVLADGTVPVDGANGDIDTDGSGYLKGSLLCINRKIVQKFCNGTICELDVKLLRLGSSYGQFFLADEPQGYPQYNKFIAFPTSAGASQGPYEVFTHEGGPRLEGWVDDLVHEGFWFDGSEVAGTYTLQLTFTLSTL